MSDHTGGYSMSPEDTDPARLEEQNVQVTRADREAAADAVDELGGDWGYCGDIREGRVAHPLVQAFARHRTRAEPDLVEAAVASLHPAWFASDYNHREAQRAVRAALSRSGEGNHAG